MRPKVYEEPKSDRFTSICVKKELRDKIKDLMFDKRLYSLGQVIEKLIEQDEELNKKKKNGKSK